MFQRNDVACLLVADSGKMIRIPPVSLHSTDLKHNFKHNMSTYYLNFSSFKIFQNVVLFAKVGIKGINLLLQSGVYNQLTKVESTRSGDIEFGCTPLALQSILCHCSSVAAAKPHCTVKTQQQQAD